VKPVKLIVSGGGTGGHIYPALSIAAAIKQEQKNADILFVGARGKMEMEKVPKAGFPIRGLWISGFQRSLSIQNLLFPLKLVVSLIHSFFILRKFKPTIVVGTGGFASGPLLQVAQWLNIPTLIQEQNSYPGITNRILGKKVDRICVAYEGMERYFPSSKTVLTGNPIRASICVSSKDAKKAKSFFKLNPKKKTLVILGGSLGSQRINELIASEIEFFKNCSLEVVWQCGALYYDRYKSMRQDGLVVKPFVYEMDQLFAAADFIISRSGAGSLSELSCVGKPLLLVPSPNVTANHQYHNAMALVKVNAARLIEEKELEDKFEDVFSEIITNQKLQKEMQKQLKLLAKPQATQHIVNEMRQLI
jgi:UDP-N-acetylglucosamine--N-acetylmuramyl-(pentapeptide) pyrophosphoryl-undecaprenol N-acetylglucosamine transferase